ncbi:hemagglutinin repeat-containing protein [Cupriavidus basilensis]|uniref:Putative large exoprotein involved in heme utilization or adhesion of ShlA/HecA/FhaA family n=1 Tax=Cupriavidus basilensis TaxID=68895 RepID=A0A0C4YIW3_9BURK|nr:hemagglutinin repeat-containing protein [Cupriavidus basilensis]AJG22983.1 Putative large exoprotein involved in heme utilization or adhesion of ShlA/HecA/FhaA family [Cupriavidus basilensis]
MNKGNFRLVYSRHRGMLVAVEESAVSIGKGQQGGARAQRRSRRAGQGPAPVASMVAALPAMPRTRFASLASTASFASLTSIALLGLAAPATAQIVADPNAGANRPGVIQTSNGLAQVNITRPSGAGVSTNAYTQFDVARGGAILNNSPTIVSTQQAGFVNGNPNLLPGQNARIIVNQVTSALPSQLRGYLEVAGARAEVVVANPNGIMVDGGGFINTSRATLTTGVPVYGGTGSLDAFRVTGGQISVQGAGLNASNVDQADLIARSVTANAAIYANNLNVIAGASQVDRATLAATPIAGTAPAPGIGIDVSQLGGMYANKILLVGTEAGVGVSNRGVLAAQAGDLTLSAQGRLELAGKTSASGNLAITARGGVENSGTTYGAQAVSLDTAGALGNSGTLAAQQGLRVNAGSVLSSGTMGAGVNGDGTIGQQADLSVVAAGTLSASGKHLAGGNASLQGAALQLAGSQNAALGNLSLAAGAGDINLSGASSQAGGALSANASGALVNDRGELSSQGTTTITAGSVSNQGGRMLAQGAATLQSAGAVNNQQGELQAGGALAVNAGSLDNATGRIEGDLVGIRTAGGLANRGGAINQFGKADTGISAGGVLDNTSGTLATNGKNLTVDAQSLSNDSGHVAHAGDGTLAVTSRGALGNAAGTIQSNGALDLRAAGAVANTAGRIEAAGTHGALSLAGASVDNTAGRIVNAGDGLTRVQAQQALVNANAGRIGGNGKVELAAGTLSNHAQITAKGAASLDAQSLDNGQGSITAGEALTATVAGAASNRQGTLSGGVVELSAASLDNATGRIEGDQVGIRTTGNLSNSGGAINQFGKADTSINAGGAFDNTTGTLATNGKNLTVDAQSLANDGGRIAHAGDGTLALTSRGALGNTAGAIQGNGTLAVQAASLDNTRGNLSAQGAASVTTAAGLVNRQGTLYGQSGLSLSSQGQVDNTGGTAQTSGDLAVAAAGALNNAGGTFTANGAHGKATVSASGIDNRGGRLANAGDGATAITAAGTLDNTGGTLGGNGDVALAATDLANASGAQIAAAGALTLGVTRSVDNRSGRIYGAKGLTLNQAGTTLANEGGNVLGGANVQLTLASMTNQGGAVRANQDVGVSSLGGTVSGSGEMTAGRNLTLNVAGDYLNDASNKLRADGDLQLRASGAVTNTGTLAAGGSLAVRGANVNNAAGAGINSQATTVQADGTITNAGRIEGNAVNTSSGALANTGAVIGNTVQVQAADVSNTGPAAVIAAAQDLKIHASNAVSNLDGALIYSAGNLQIARDGTRDPGTGMLANQVGVLNNRSATIEADGDIDIAARTVNNTRTSIVTEAGTPQTTTTQTLSLWLAGLGDGETNGHLSATFPGWAWRTTAASISGDMVNALRAPVTLEVPKSNVVNLNTTAKTLSFTQPPFETYGGYNGPICNDNGCTGGDGPGGRPFATNPTQYYQDIQDTGTTYRITFWPDWDPAKHMRPDQVRVRYDLGPDVHDYSETSRTTVTTVATDRLVSATAAARVQAQGSIRINSDGGNVLNQSSIMAAGGNLSRRAAGGAIQDVGTVLQQTVSTTDTSTFYWHQKSGGNSDEQTVPYPTTPQAPTTVAALPALATANQAVQTSAQDITVGSVNRVGQTVTGSGVAGGSASGTQLDSLAGTAGAAPTLGAGPVAAATGATNRLQTLGTAAGGIPNLTLPANGLFTLRPAPATPYLIETDSRFTQYKTFLSSDYMLGALGLDPQQVQKRLGDGFYEEKLVRDQVTALTGRTFLAGYTDQMKEYQALMNSGVTYAKSFGLSPGVGLSDDQMRQLTTDMVWLVAQDVTLPDGTHQSVLVPKVYLVQSNAVDLNSTGALVTGNSVALNATGNVNNSGRIVGDVATQVLGNNIVNRGAIGDTTGTTVVQALQDVRNLGGRIGGQDVLVQAGRDVVNETQTVTEVRTIGPNGYSAGATGVAAVAAISAAGNAVVLAGRDVTLSGAVLEAGKGALIGAGRDLTIGAVTLGTTQDAVSRGGQSYAHDKTSTVAGSTVQAGGNVVAVAGRDAALAGSSVGAGGDVSLIAGRDLTVTAEKDTTAHSEGSLGGKGASYTQAAYDETVRGSTVQGGTSATLAAGQTTLAAGLLEANGITAAPVTGTGKGSVTLTGSEVSAGKPGATGATGSGVSIVATQDITIGEAREVHDASYDGRSKSSGLLSRSASHDQTSSHADLGVGSLVSGDTVRVAAGNDLTVRQSGIAATDSVTLAATRGNVLITAGQNTREESYAHEQTSSGLSAFAGKGGIGISAGSNQANSAGHAVAVTQSDARSTVGATNGNVTISAGRDATILGSDLIAGRKDGNTTAGHIDIQAQNIAVLAGVDHIAQESSQSSRSSGLSMALTGTPLDTARNLQDIQRNPSTVTRAKQTLDELGAAAFTAPQVGITLGSNRSSSQVETESISQKGSQLTAAGDIRLRATGNGNKDASGKATDGNILIAGSTVSAGAAAILDAQRDVLLQASTDSYREATSSSSSGWSLSTAAPSLGDIGRFVGGGPNNGGVSMLPYGSQKASASGDASATRQNATVVTGNTVAVKARSGDITIAGSGLSAEGDLTLAALQGKVDILSGQDSKTKRSDSSSRQIGDLGGTGYTGTVGIRTESHHLDTAQTTENTIRSQVVSQNGNVTISAKDDLTARGADIAAGKDVTLIGKNVVLDPGKDTANSHQVDKTSQYGVTLALSGYAVTAAQTIENAARGMEDSKNDRLRGLYAAQAALAVANGVSTVRDLASGGTGGTALIKATVSIGGGSSESESRSQASANQGTTVKAGNAVTIVAAGSGGKDANGYATDGDITGRGVQIDGKTVTLSAARDVNLESAQDTASQSSKSSGSNASIGVGLALGGQQNGFTLELAASQNKAKGDGDAVTNHNSHVSASDQLTITSGRDSNLKGAQVTGDTVRADVGRNLNVESRQDTDNYHSRESSSGFQASLCVPPFCYGTTVSASASVSSGNTDSTYNSVREQSGIYAGNGGFQVSVKENTDLKGAVLASTADAGKNSLTTGTLTTSDIENKAEYSSSSSTIAGSFDSGQSLLKNGVNTLAATAAGSAQKAIEGDAAGTTKSAIANGTVTITNAEAQKEKTGKPVDETLASLNRDTDGANQAIDKIFDAKRVKEQQEANKLQAQIVQQVMPMVYQRIGTALQGQPEAIKVAVHALVGGLVSQALGGDFGKGVAGVAAGTAAIALLNDKLGSMGLSEDDRNAVLQTVGMLVAGAVAGGGAEGSAAAAAAGMADTYNRLLHNITRTDVVDLARKEAAKMDMTPDQLSRAMLVVLGDYFDANGNPRSGFGSVTYDQYMAAQAVLLSQPANSPMAQEYALAQRNVLPQFAFGDADSTPNLGRIPGSLSPKIGFGNNANQTYHTFRHIDDVGLDRVAVQTKIGGRLSSLAPVLPSGPYNGTVLVNGKTVDFVAFKGGDGKINVGRITVRGEAK